MKIINDTKHLWRMKYYLYSLLICPKIFDLSTDFMNKKIAKCQKAAHKIKLTSKSETVFSNNYYFLQKMKSFCYARKLHKNKNNCGTGSKKFIFSSNAQKLRFKKRKMNF